MVSAVKKKISTRILLDDGSFGDFQEDVAETDAALERAGITREDMNAEQHHRRIINRNKGRSQLADKAATLMTDAELEAEMKRRQVVKDQATKKAKTQTVTTNPMDEGGIVTEDKEDFSKYTVAELKGLLDDKGLLYAPSSKKAKLLEILAKDGKLGAGVEDGL